MKRALSIILSLAMTLSIFFAYSVFAEEADATSAASETTTEYTTTSVTTTAVPVPVIAEGAETYTVVPGDYLWKIARASSLTLDEILALNPQIINANLIYPGQVIVIKTAPAPVETVDTAAVGAPAYLGLGEVQNVRVGGHLGLNVVNCAAIFDSNGKIVKINWDILEVGLTEDTEDGQIVMFEGTQDEANTALQAYETKREEGFDYGMAARNETGEWFEQTAYYEEFFKGMTVEEVVAWTDKHLNATGDLIKPTTEDADEQAKLAQLSEEEMAELADVITSATMALRDDHGDFIGALVKAWENKTEL